MAISRRTLIRYGLGGACLLGIGGAGLALQPTRIRTPSGRLRALDERTFSILAAVADRIAPSGNGFPTAASLGVAENIDALLVRSDPALVDEVKQLLLLLENGLAGLVFDGRIRTFTSLSPEDQDAVLLAWRRSSLSLRRTGYKALHGLCAAAYYASPEVYERLGYPGPPDFGNFQGASQR